MMGSRVKMITQKLEREENQTQAESKEPDKIEKKEDSKKGKQASVSLNQSTSNENMIDI